MSPPPPPPSPPPRRAAAELAFSGEASAYTGTDDTATPLAKASPVEPLLLAAEVPAGVALSVAFQTTLGGKPAAPQQAVLRLGGNDDGPSAYVWARRRKGGEAGDLVVTVTHAEVERQIGRAPAAALPATLLVGDPSAAAPQGVEWALGEVRFAEAVQRAAGDGSSSSSSSSNAKHQHQQPKLLTAAHQPLHNALPDIRHTFRRPERRAPAVLSLAFTALALLPLAILVPALLAAGANLKGWPSSGGSDPSSAGAWAAAFLASLAATLGLLVVFWLRLTLATVLWPAVALGSALWYTGWRALRAQAALRVAAEEGEVGGAAKKKA
jgi:oligosaccharyltransferase complex subunit delta (ribophorin II)